MAPGGQAVATTDELRAALATAGTTKLVYLLPVVYPLGGTPLEINGTDVTLEGAGDGSTIIDAELQSRAFTVSNGGQLTLRGLGVVNGNATSGGGLLVHGAGSSLVMEQASVRECVATGLIGFVDGGGAACMFKRLAHTGPLPPPAACLSAYRHALKGCCQPPKIPLLREHRRVVRDRGRECRPGGEHDCGLRWLLRWGPVRTGPSERHGQGWRL